MVELTENAIKKIKTFENENSAYQGKKFRVYVQGGGCKGFSYGFAFDEKRDGDEENKAGDIQVLLDPQSAQYLSGSLIDYIEDYRGSGFVIENPNQTGSCGCGDSVSF